VEVSEYLDIPVKSVRDQVYRRVGVGQYAFRVGRFLRWEWSDIDAFVESQKRSHAEAA
jgi:hypothetical protein